MSNLISRAIFAEITISRGNTIHCSFAGVMLAAVTAFGLALLPGPASAQMMSYAPAYSGTSGAQTLSPPDADDEAAVLPDRLKRTVVAFETREAPGTIVIDTGNTSLYYVLGGGRAIRYGVGVGRQGFTWSGVENVSRKAEWPDWIPPSEMIARQPYLPRWVAGGPGNPLGARAMYLGNSSYRIHGTNDPTTIGKFVSSGCIRMTNEDVIDLFGRVQLGAKVVVLPKRAPEIAINHAATMAPRRISAMIPVADRSATQRQASGGAGAIY